MKIIIRWVPCVYDSDPKTLTDQQLESLQILANEVETHLRLRVNQDQLKEQLLQENKFNQKVINSLPVNFFMYNKKGELIRWNDNIKRTTGYSDKEIKQMQPEDYFENEDRETVVNNIEHVFEGGEAMFEANVIVKDGPPAPFIFSISSFEMDNETYMIGTGQDISEQKETQYKLARSSKEKDVLLAEIHHRVKNNLAVISGIMQLETLQDGVTDSEKALMNTILRIRTMARVHEVMYEKEDLTHVALEEVINTIVENIKTTYRRTDNITLSSKVKDIILNVNQAIPLGLIINELLKNAWKHAYPDGVKGIIDLELNEYDGDVVLRIADKGQGLSEDIGPNLKGSIGLTFVENFASQLNAELDINRESGTEYNIRFKKRDVKGSSSALNIQYN
ncbi:histidine kinase dimerization/phosphoacceptor domain -containing protein [Gracilimonas sp. Q87]|uniref:PAS domain-containing sensor histidine kinase n=1 Tax=Gracilimonas sp. Q87 TaxID=3384766 RepID=UPI003983F5BE